MRRVESSSVRIIRRVRGGRKAGERFIHFCAVTLAKVPSSFLSLLLSLFLSISVANANAGLGGQSAGFLDLNIVGQLISKVVVYLLLRLAEISNFLLSVGGRTIKVQSYYTNTGQNQELHC